MAEEQGRSSTRRSAGLEAAPQGSGGRVSNRGKQCKTQQWRILCSWRMDFTFFNSLISLYQDGVAVGPLWVSKNFFFLRKMKAKGGF